MYAVAITIHVQPGQEETFLKLTESLVTATRAEPGCKWFDVLRNEKQRNTFVSYEAFESAEAFRDHMSLPHTREWREKLRPLLAAEGIVYPSHASLFVN